ncbi:MAG: DJ-1/PfpI family protein [Eubacterium sp.]|nr:DJ-1/PfpI family protein [Candidatus Colimonas fimequi]
MVYVHLANGFEEIEALMTVDMLRRAKVDVQLVSVTGELIVHGAHNIDVQADILFEEADYDSCEMIVLPGGMPGALNLQNHEGLKEKIMMFAQAGRNLAAICAAPMVFGAHGIFEGNKATIYPGMEDRLVGAVPVNAGAVKDGNIITGKGPGFAADFALTILETLTDKETADSVAEGFLISR